MRRTRPRAASRISRSTDPIVLLALVVCSCFAPNLGDEPFLCAAAEPRCPPDYVCAGVRCVRGAVTVDGGAADAPVGSPDAPRPDAGGGDAAACVPGSRCAGDDLIVCSTSREETVTHCALGCNAATTRCFALVPSNLPADVCERAVTAPRRVTGQTNIDTTVCQGGTVVPQTSNGQSICMLLNGDITIEAAGVLRATGDKPLALVATGAMTIQGKIDVSGRGGTGGAGAGPGFVRGIGGLQADLDGGGGGAGYGTAGGGGGGATSMAGKAGVAYGSADLKPLLPGSPGGAGCSGTCEDDGGGAGGGAVHIVACGTLALSGSILAGGQGGQGGLGGILLVTLAGGGSGGGSGGAILVEAAAISLDGTAVLAANGGGGGGGGEAILSSNPGRDGSEGEDGTAAARAALGGEAGMPSTSGDGQGGNGGALAAPAETGFSGLASQGAGGGGGAVGRIRLNTRDGRAPVLAPGAVVSPAATSGTVGKR